MRTVDGKRPSFVHDQQDAVVQPVAAPQAMPDEEPDEDLLARIRQAWIGSSPT